MKTSQIVAAVLLLAAPALAQNGTPPEAPKPPRASLPSEICLRETNSPFQLQITTDRQGQVLDVIVIDRTDLGNQRFFLDSAHRPAFSYTREADGTQVVALHLDLPDRVFVNRPAAFLDVAARVSASGQVTGSFYYISKDGLRRIFGADLHGEAGTSEPAPKCNFTPR